MSLLEKSIREAEERAKQKIEQKETKIPKPKKKIVKQKQPKKQEKVYHGTLSTIYFLLYGKEPPHETGMSKKKLKGLIIKKLNESE